MGVPALADIYADCSAAYDWPNTGCSKQVPSRPGPTQVPLGMVSGTCRPPGACTVTVLGAPGLYYVKEAVTDPARCAACQATWLCISVPAAVIVGLTIGAFDANSPR